ncbi:hypothetical protein LPE509_03000 [Legionella pneumophila subsp. pneumophila LPE509]|nr:hypothetical protein LPE509_03000 [Legionella pneumophila subsp. pneumophila LPE509]
MIARIKHHELFSFRQKQIGCLMFALDVVIQVFSNTRQTFAA